MDLIAQETQHLQEFVVLITKALTNTVIHLKTNRNVQLLTVNGLINLFVLEPEL